MVAIWRRLLVPTTALACALAFYCLFVGFDSQGIMSKNISFSFPDLWKSSEGIDFQGLSIASNFSVAEIRTLDRILHNAQIAANKTVILTTLNQAWAERNTMIDLFLDSFDKGVAIRRFLAHLVIVALDLPSFQRCVQIHDHCFMLHTAGIDFSGEQKRFMSEDYLAMMWRRIYFLRVVLQLGYSFVFTDADILWFRDPFPQFHPVAEFEIASDSFNGIENDLGNHPNGGFVHVVASNRTIALYKLWYEARLRFPGLHDQDVFNRIKESPEFSALGVKVRFLSTEFFGGFCERPKDFGIVITMHANCCGSGLENKLYDLQLVAEDWNLWKMMTQDQREKYKVEWRVPRHC